MHASIDYPPAYTEETWPTCKEIVRYLLPRIYGQLNTEELIGAALQTAAEADDLDFIRWLIDRPLQSPQLVYRPALSRACSHGRIQIVELLLSRMARLGQVWPSRAMFTAAKSGQLGLVQWLYERYGRNPRNNLFRDVVNENDSEDAITAELGDARFTEMDIAAKHGHLEVVQFLHRIERSLLAKRKTEARMARTPHCTTRAMDAAAGGGHLAVVKWLHENRSEGCTAAAMNNAAGQAYHEPGCKRNVSCCDDKGPDSFVDNQIAMLEWLKSNRTEGCTSLAMHMAAYRGNLVVLQWLHENTSVRPLPHTMDNAADDGRLDIVKWLHEVGAGCTADAMNNAASNGHLDVVKWLYTNRSEGQPERALFEAAGYNRFCFRKPRNQLGVVRFLSTERSVVITIATMKALLENHFDVVLLLHAQRPDLSDHLLQLLKERLWLQVNPSRRSANQEMFEWLEENYPAWIND